MILVDASVLVDYLQRGSTGHADRLSYGRIALIESRQLLSKQ
jgi:hypothetical protein